MTKNLAIIPARSGSKRIPQKNIQHFFNKPIIAYSIETALKSELFAEVMVSTDDEYVAQIAKHYGAKVPFLRNKETATDNATLSDVVEEVLLKYQQYKQNFDYVCCILATAPLLKIERISEAYNKMLKESYDAVFPVVRFSYPIQRALRLNNGKISMFNPENIFKRSQDFEPAYHDSGQFYWINTDVFLKQKRFFTENTGAIILSELEAHDIDTKEDWQVAELKYRLLNGI